MTMTASIQKIRDLAQVQALVVEHNRNAQKITDFHDVYDATFFAMLAQQTFANEVFCIMKNLLQKEEYNLFFTAMAHKLREAPPNYCCYILHYSDFHWFLYLVKKKEDGSLFILLCDSMNYKPSLEFQNMLDREFVNKYSLMSLLDVINFKSCIQRDASSCGIIALDFLKRLNALFSNNPWLFINIENIQSNQDLQKLLKIIVLRNTQIFGHIQLLPLPTDDYRRSSKKPAKEFPESSLVWRESRSFFNIIKTISWLRKTDLFLGTKTQKQWEQIIDEFTLQISLLQETEFNIFQQLLKRIRGGNYQEEDKIVFCNLIKKFLGKNSPPMISVCARYLAMKNNEFNLSGFNL